MCCQVSQVPVDIPPTPQNDIDVPRTGLFHIEVNKKKKRFRRNNILSVGKLLSFLSMLLFPQLMLKK